MAITGRGLLAAASIDRHKSEANQGAMVKYGQHVTMISFLRFTVVVLTSLTLTNCVTNGRQETVPAVLTQDEVSAQLFGRAIPRQIKDKIIRLHHDDPVERAWAAFQLAKIGRGAANAVPYLIRLLDDETPVLLSRYMGGGYHSSLDTTPAEEAAHALANMDEYATPKLLKALQSTRANVRRLAAKALGHIGGIEAIDPLIGLLDDSDRRVHAAAAIALGNYRHPRTAQKIMDAIPGAHPAVRADMVYALAQVNDIVAVPFLMKRLKNEDPDVRAAIVFTLGKLRDARALAVLLESRSDPDDIVRTNSVYALGNYYAPHVIDALIKSLDDEVGRVREGAGEVLEQLTARNFGTDKNKWKNWWDVQKNAMQDNKKGK